MVKVVTIRDCFRRPEAAEPEVLLEHRPGMRIRDCVPRDFNLEGGNVVLRNGRSLSGEEIEAVEVLDRDELVFGQVPGIVAAIVGAVVGSAELSAGAAFAVAVADFILMAAISVGISYGLAALTAPKSRLSQGQDDGPSRSWEGIQDTSGSGRPIPFVYGKLRTGGQFLQSFERAITGEQVRDGLTTLHTLLGVCLGPVQSIGDIEINGNKLDTIPDCTADVRLGTAEQAAINGFFEIEKEVIIQRPIAASDGIVSFFTTTECEALEIFFRFPNGLLRASKTGNPLPHDVTFRYEVKEFGFGSNVVVAVGEKTVSAQSRNPIKGSVKITTDAFGDELRLGRYEIRIQRLTPDDASQSGSLTYNSASEVYAITEITYESQAHPGLAMVGLKQVPSAQLNTQVPTSYTFLVEGFNDIRVYTDLSTYTRGYTRNPAWCAAHFLTSPIHGLGDKYTWDNIALAAFLDWAAYCDELVDDGKGGFEPRAVFDHCFDQVQAADDAVSIFAEGSGVLLIKRASRWTVVIDRADSMIWVGNEGNIKPGTFRYSFLPAAQVANRLQVAFLNGEDNYRRDTYFDELPGLEQGEPYVEASRSLWGVTRPSQISREVKRLLLHNKLDVTQVELESGLDALRVSAGSIFGVSILTAGVGIASGRILAVDETLSRIRLDAEVTLEDGKVYEITVHHAQGDEISTKRIVNAPGTTDEVFSADIAWAGAIAAGDTYSLGEFESSVEKYRCVEVSLDNQFGRKIRGLRYDPAVYTGVLEALPTVVKNSIPAPRLFPPDVTELVLTERLDTNPDGSLVDVIDVDWTAPVSAILDHFEVWVRLEDALNFSLAGLALTGHFTVRSVLTPGFTYEISVVPVSTNGVRKRPDLATLASLTTSSVTIQPPDPTNLRATITDGTLVATVDEIPPSQLGPGGYYEWRRGSGWNQSLLIEKTAKNRLELKSYARGSATLLVKAVNSLGNKSKNAASVSITLYGQVEENIILEQEEFPDWPGQKIGFNIEDGTFKLSLLQPATANLMLPRRRRNRRSARRLGFGAPPLFPLIIPVGVYTTEIITASSDVPVRARPDVAIDWEAIFLGLGTFDTATFPFDSEQARVPFAGDENAENLSLLIESRVSTTDTSESSFGPWIEHRDRGELTFKYIQFRLTGRTISQAYSLKIDSMKISIDLPDKVVSGRVPVASAVSVDVDYPTDYFVAVKRLLVSLIGGANGDYVKVTVEDETGFTAEIRDSSHALTTGTIHFEARGY